LSLDGYLSLDTYDGYDAAVFESINVQIINGNNNTLSKNGLGNLIVGYNENEISAAEFCSISGNYTEGSCLGVNGIWANNVHTGSHNIVLGKGNSYDDNAALVAGFLNISNQNYGSVLSGENNQADGEMSVIVTGISNLSLGTYSSILSGSNNAAYGTAATVSGGASNIASNQLSHVSGGESNSAIGISSTVSGGKNRSVTGVSDWRAGSLFETQ
jgi:hypothetical protein